MRERGLRVDCPSSGRCGEGHHSPSERLDQHGPRLLLRSPHSAKACLQRAQAHCSGLGRCIQVRRSWPWMAPCPLPGSSRRLRTPTTSSSTAHSHVLAVPHGPRPLPPDSQSPHPLPQQGLGWGEAPRLPCILMPGVTQTMPSVHLAPTTSTAKIQLVFLGSVQGPPPSPGCLQPFSLLPLLASVLFRPRRCEGSWSPAEPCS